MNSSARPMLRIGELARRAGVTPRTIRFYVQERLLPEPVRQQKNLALYRADCIEKIRAIKSAQTERFLPLMVIRTLLEQNGFDYAVLSEPAAPLPDRPRDAENADLAPQVPESVLEILSDGPPYRLDPEQSRLLRFLHDKGADWDGLRTALEQIGKMVEGIVDLEMRKLMIHGLNHPQKDFEALLAAEEKVISRFIATARKRHLGRLIRRQQAALDNAYLATGDEGFALPAEEIAADLRRLEKRMRPRKPDPRILNDLAIGWSCVGDLDKAGKLLERARRNFPDHVETRFRRIWYRRFARRQGDHTRLRNQLLSLVAAHPRHALGPIFLAGWLALEATTAEDPYCGLGDIGQCLQALERARTLPPENLHDWVLIQYGRGRILTVLDLSRKHLKTGIEAFEAILHKKEELDAYYEDRMPFFPKWLWPNLYCFLGESYLRAGRRPEARVLFGKAKVFRVQPPFQKRMEANRKAAMPADTS